jgi:asparagine synthase (glutamine-hydrolysing)
VCGIAGIVGSLPGDQLRGVGARMISTLKHRGPDDSGVWLDSAAGIAMGHQRLSIVDVSSTGHQPMISSRGRYVLTFNGEIYNHRQIRHELDSQAGILDWRGHSDTEVFLAAIEHWGVSESIAKCVGMFAFGLWDREERILHLARDRLGEKPLYFGIVAGTLVFSSELKAFRVVPGWSGEIDRKSLAAFMRYSCVPASQSIYRNVFKLPPAGLLSIPCTNLGRLAEKATIGRVRRYWSAFDFAARASMQPTVLDDGQACEQLEKLLVDAVTAQMQADVPLGAFLSGGIDSTTVVALMQRVGSNPVKTFSIGFDDTAYNEAEHAKKIAKYLGTEHTELYVRAEDALAVIPKLPALYDEPFADASQIPTYLLSKLAKNHVTVSLSGDGGDELFGGYNRHLWIPKLTERRNRFSRAGLRLVGRLLESAAPFGVETLLATAIPGRFRSMQSEDKLIKLAKILSAGTTDDAYLAARSCWNNPEDIVMHATDSTILGDGSDNGMRIENSTQRMMFLDLISYLPDDILVKLDRASMGVSLESRVPLLDHRLVEFALRLPLSMKIRDGSGKWLLRQVLYKHVPRELLERPKAGFSLPIHDWLRGPLGDWAESLLSRSALEAGSYLNADVIIKRWNEHKARKRNWQHQLWCVLMFQAWLTDTEGAASAESCGIDRFKQGSETPA